MKAYLLKLVLGFWFISTSIAADAYPTSPKLLAFSDFHFNPFAACKEITPCQTVEKLRQADVSQWESILSADDTSSIQTKADTNHALLVSTLNEMKQRVASVHPDFVVVLGDYLSHNFRQYFTQYSSDSSDAAYQAFVKKTYEYLNEQMAATFPNVNVYIAIGNNDSYQDDYVTEPKGALFKDLSLLWSSLIKDTTNQVAMRQQFANNGYYAVEAIPGKLRLIALNSNLWVKKAVGDMSLPASEELSWLHAELEDATKKNEKVLLIQHAPDAIDVYGTLKKLPTISTLFDSVYSNGYEAEIKEHAANIVGILGGHFHCDLFQFVKDAVPLVPISGVPAISTLFGNNPGYKVYELDAAQYALQNYQTYFYDVTKNDHWSMEYDFNATYQPDCQYCLMFQGMQHLQKTGDLAERYRWFFAVSNDSQPITTQWMPYYWCQIFNSTASDYEACIKA